MSSRILTILAICLSCTGMVFAEWHSFTNAREENLQVNVLSSTDQEVQVEVTIPGYHLYPIKADGKECVVISIPGASWVMEKGFPLLPKLANLIKIPAGSTPTISVISKEEVEVELTKPIVPSKGHLTRDIDPESIAFEFGPIYTQNTFWVEEKDQFTIGEPFMLHDIYGVRAQVIPIRANHVTMKMMVLKKAIISIKCDCSFVPLTASEPSREFSSLYKSYFLNYEETAPLFGVEEIKPRLMVIVPEQFYSLLGDWLNLKKINYDVTVKVMNTTASADIFNYLQTEYKANKFAYVVLFGDVDTMPTMTGKFESAASDRCYVRYTGVGPGNEANPDNYPDACISRISGNATQITTQLQKIVKYEQTTFVVDWMKKGITIASNQGSPTDAERAGWIITGGGTTQKVPIPTGLQTIFTGGFSKNYDPTATASGVAAAVNAGAGIICYIGHGSTTSWGTTGFSNTNIASLTNGNMLPVIWSVACVNGSFKSTSECFAEAWLRKSGGGAVAMEAASTNEAWVPPCDKQAETVNAYIRKLDKTFGMLEYRGCVKGLEVWGDANNGQGNQMAEQCNLFGDCSMVVFIP